MTQTLSRAFIGIGSNLDNPTAQVEAAFEALSILFDSRLQSCSSLYRSAPMGPPDQPDYINAVAELHTSLEPIQLLDALQTIERQQGRKRVERWGPRTLDLDLLLYDELVRDDATLSLPHPGIADRPFVLYPLSELVSEIEIPGYGLLSELLADCSLFGLSKLDHSNSVVQRL